MAKLQTRLHHVQQQLRPANAARACAERQVAALQRQLAARDEQLAARDEQLLGMQRQVAELLLAFADRTNQQLQVGDPQNLLFCVNRTL